MSSGIVGLCMGGLAAVPYLAGYYGFPAVFLIRLLQGFSGALVGSSCYSISASAYASRQETVAELSQIVSGLGIILGPLTGGLLYLIGGFSFMFGSYAIMLISVAILSAFAVPSCDRNEAKSSTVQLSEMIECPGVLKSAFAVGVAMMAFNFLQPVLVFHLLTFDISLTSAAGMYVLPSVTYAMSVIIVSRLPEAIDFKATICLGLVVSSIALCLVSPVEVVPSNLYVVGIGLALIGIGLALTVVTTLPEMMKCAHKRLSQYDSLQVSDTASGLVSSCLFIGELLAPPLAGFLTDWLAFESAILTASAGLALVSVMYGAMGGGFAAMSTCSPKHWMSPPVSLLDNSATDRSVDSVVELVD